MLRARLLGAGSAGALVALGFAGCRDATAIRFTVTTDVQCASVRSTSVAVGDLASLESKPPASVSRTCEAGKVGSIVVVPSGADDGEVAVRVVAGLDGVSADDCAKSGYKSGCIVARRALHFIPHTTVEVPIVLEASCRDVPCAPTETCVRGACVSASLACAGKECALAAPTPTPTATTTTTVPPPTPTPPPTRWHAMRSGSAGGVTGRSHANAVWTGKVMLVWAGDIDGSLAADGGIYDPALDTWQILPAGPLGPRAGSAGVWTGKELIVWGGYDTNADLADGAGFDPETHQWRTIPAAPLVGRFGAGAVFAPTTGEMIVWGGSGYHSANDFADGAAFDVAKGTWRALEAAPLAPRRDVQPVWLGERALFYNGGEVDGALYDPKARTWSSKIAGPISGRAANVVGWSGDAAAPIVLWGGGDRSSVSFDDGVLLDPKSLQFTTIPSAKAVLPDPARFDGGGFVTSSKLYVWGGGVWSAPPDVKLAKVVGDGASFDFASQAWSAMPTAGAPSARRGHVVVWTGREAIVWGGEDLGEKHFADGAIFGP